MMPSFDEPKTKSMVWIGTGCSLNDPFQGCRWYQTLIWSRYGQETSDKIRIEVCREELLGSLA